MNVDYGYTKDEIIENFEVLTHIKAYIIGSFSLAIISATVLGICGYVFFLIFDKRKVVLNNG